MKRYLLLSLVTTSLTVVPMLEIAWGLSDQPSPHPAHTLPPPPLMEGTGGVVIEYTEHKALAPGVWLTGPVPRRHPERNWSGRLQVESPTGWTADTVPESQSLIFDTIKGLVVLSGCGHAGIINTIDHARNVIRAAPVHAALGGFHLLAADDDHLQWTADSLKDVGLINFMGAHCTGIEAVFRMRSQAGLTRKTCVVGAVGASFSLNKGIDPLALAR